MWFQKKAAFFGLEEWEKEEIKKSLKGFRTIFFDEPLTSANAKKAKDAVVLGIFIYSKIDADVLSQMPKLKMIATLSTGYDHIDIAECTSRKIIVCNVPTYGENSVAEHTFALILAMSRKIFQSIERTKKGGFNYDGLTGFDLKGKTLGLVGTGHISSNVARIAYGFEMKLLGFDMNQNPELIQKYGMQYVDLKRLLSDSDIVSLHLPYNEKTKHIINKDNIGQMKKSAIIINTARGALIETDALVKALQKGKIAGAGLDVLEEENLIKEEKQLLTQEFSSSLNMQTLLENHILLNSDNVVVTPHNAFNSQEALKRIIDTSIENIKNFGKNPSNVVNPANTSLQSNK